MCAFKSCLSTFAQPSCVCDAKKPNCSVNVRLPEYTQFKSRKSRPLSRLRHVPAAQQVEIYRTGDFFPRVAPSDQDDAQPSARIFKDLESRRVSVSPSPPTAFITSRRLECASRLDLITSNGTLYLRADFISLRKIK